MTGLLLSWLCALGAGAEVSPPPLVEAPELPDAVPALPPGAVTPPPLVEAPEAPFMPQDFVKGELSVFLGSDRLVTKKSRIGVSIGVDQIGQAFYLALEPQVDLRLFDRQLAIGAGVPLRLELVDLANGPDGLPILTRHQWELRGKDYVQPRDFARLLKYVTWGRKEDRLYVNVGQRYASSIGHGALVRRYAPNIDVDLTRVSAQLDAYGDYAGVELFTNDVMAWNLPAGLAFVKPLAFFDDGLVARSLSVGFSAAADTDAPVALAYDAARGGRQLGADGRFAGGHALALLYGIDAEVKVVKTPHVDVKPYVDYSVLKGGDAGLTVGALGRFNAFADPVHAFRAIFELRSLGPRYVPSYFDTFYEVERYAARELPQPNGIARYATKLEDVTSGRRPQRLGYYLEGSWGIRGRVGFTLAVEGTGDSAEKNLVAHLEVPAVDFLQFFGSYYKRGFVDFGEVAKIDERTILFAGARLKILPFLFVNGRAFKTFKMDAALRRYDNSPGFAVDVELGYEFDLGRDPPG